MNFPNVLIIDLNEAIVKANIETTHEWQQEEVVRQCITSFHTPQCSLHKKHTGSAVQPVLRTLDFLDSNTEEEVGFALEDAYITLHDEVAKTLIVYGGLNVEKANGYFNYNLKQLRPSGAAVLEKIKLLPYDPTFSSPECYR